MIFISVFPENSPYLLRDFTAIAAMARCRTEDSSAYFGHGERPVGRPVAVQNVVALLGEKYSHREIIEAFPLLLGIAAYENQYNPINHWYYISEAASSLWSFNTAIENCPFRDDSPINNGGFYMAMSNYRRVAASSIQNYSRIVWSKANPHVLSMKSMQPHPSMQNYVAR